MSDLVSIPFVPGTGLNYDDDPRFMQPGDGDRENVAPVNDGIDGLLPTIKGNILKVLSPAITGTIQSVIGATYDVKTRSIIFFLKSRTGATVYDSIIRYNVSADTFTVIVRENALLNFGDRVEARVLDDYLIWATPKVHAVSIPEAIAFTAGATSVYEGSGGNLTAEEMSFIRYAPSEMPTVAYDTDTGYDQNYLRGKQFQFCYKFVYFDYSHSVWSPVSNVPIGAIDEDIYGNVLDYQTNNIIEVTIPEGNDLVREVHIAAREGNTALFRLVETINKEDSNWVAVGGDYTYEFKNDNRGAVIPDEEIFRLYDDVPLEADFVEVIDKNVVTLGQIKKGADLLDEITVTLTPAYADVTVTPASDAQITTNYTAGPVGAPEDAFIVLTLPDIDYDGYTVRIYWRYGDNLDWMDRTYAVATDLEDVIDDFIAQALFPDDFTKQGTGLSSTLKFGPDLESGYVEEDSVSGELILPSSAHNKNVSFKTGATHSFALVYKDAAGRVLNVLKSEDTKVDVPFFVAGRAGVFKDTSTGVKVTIGWDLGGTPHTPPTDAAYYQWFYCKQVSSIKQIDVRGTEKMWHDGGVLLDINAAVDRYREAGVNIPYYEHSDGDRVRIIANGAAESSLTVITAEYDMEIREYFEDDDYEGIVVPKDIYNFFLNEIVYLEIYSPRTSANDIYQEMSPIYTITGTTHNTTSGTFNQGDVYIRLVAPWLFGEANSYSYFYDSDSISIGRPIFYNPTQREIELSDVVHGGRYFEDTQVNELFTFRTNPPAIFSKRFGEIKGMVLRGDTLRVYQEKKTHSVYIGAAIIRRPGGTEELVASDRILGTIVTSRDDWGTQHPDSVVKVGNNIYFYDGYNHAFLRDSVNGVFPISGKVQIGDYAFDYKMRTYFKQDFTTVKCGYDPYMELLFVRTDSKTLAFHEKSNRWVSFYSFTPDYMFGEEKVFLSWKNGLTYAHNPAEVAPSDNYKYYGTAYQTIVTFYPSFPIKRIFKALSIHGSQAMDIEVTIPSDDSYTRGMFSWINDDWFTLKRGIYYAAFLRNANTTSSSDSVIDLHNGEKLRGYYAEIQMESDAGDVVELFKVDILVQ